ncbi:MAG: aspartate kinase, partial [Candidatus Margulisiibacteriota bacterium]
DVTTIGRGGSDTSAVVMAAALGAPVCEIYTDVDGIYTTDPRIVKTARKLEEISYDEMLELASLGAKVLHPRAVECAKENGVIVHVRSSFNTHPGTLVKEAAAMENNRVVTGITLNEEEAKLSIFRVPDQPGVAGRIFSRLAELNINVDMIVQSVERNHINNISFTVNQDEADQAEATLSAVAKEIGAEGVRVDRSIAKVSIVGVGMISKPGVAARMFTALGEQGINLDLISTSEIKVSCVVNRKDGRRALETLHRHFGLDVG